MDLIASRREAQLVALVGPIQFCIAYQFPPFIQLMKPTLARIVDRPGSFDFSPVCRWLLKIVTLTLGSKPSPITSSPHHPEWAQAPTATSECQLQQIAHMTPTVPAIELAPEMIVADANSFTPTKRIIASCGSIGALVLIGTARFPMIRYSPALHLRGRSGSLFVGLLFLIVFYINT